jgi:hypothetical protein
MQIHEITEGLLNNLIGAATGNYAGVAQSAAANLQQQGFGTGYQLVDANKIWPQKLEAVQKDPAVQQYIAGLVKAWQAESKTTTTEADELSTIRPATPGGPTPADRAKLAKKIKAATAATAPASQTPFETWSDAHLLSRVPGTGEQITMDEVRKLSGLGAKLEQAASKITGAQGTPVEAVAVKQYLELAIAGIQAMSQQSKSKRASGSKLSGKYAKSTGNAQADAVLKAAGFNLS